MDIIAAANLEVVDKFCYCYLGDMLSDAAMEARIRIGWNKFRQLVPLLTNRDISLIRRGRLYSSCMCEVVCYTELRPDMSQKKMRWHFSEQR